MRWEYFGTGLTFLGIGITMVLALPPPWWPSMPRWLTRTGLFLGLAFVIYGLAFAAMGIWPDILRPRLWPIVGLSLGLFVTAASIVWLFQISPAQNDRSRETKSTIQRIAVECSNQILPKMMPANETIAVISLFPIPIENGGGGIATQFSGSGQPWRWPNLPPNEAIFLSAYRCEVTNYGSDPVIDFRMALDLKFYEAVRVSGQSEDTRGHGNLKLHRSWDIAIQKIDVGRENSYKFFMINNQDDLFVHVLMPQIATLRLLGEDKNIQTRLTVAELGRDYPLTFGPNFIPKPSAEPAK